MKGAGGAPFRPHFGVDVDRVRSVASGVSETPAVSSWTAIATLPALRSGELHVVRVPVRAGDSAGARWRAWLTETERGRLQRFRFADDAQRELISRGALRELLGGYLGTEPSNLAFEVEARGKPRLAGVAAAERIEFNTSHSGDWVLLAFARGRPLGVDVERWREIESETIVRDFFSAVEIAEWQNVPAEQRVEAFFNGWTRKEAYLKALGTGLAKPLDSFHVRLAPGAVAELIGDREDAGARERWQMFAVGSPGTELEFAL